MKKILSLLLLGTFLINSNLASFAIQAPTKTTAKVVAKTQTQYPNAKKIELAFIFDGKSDKNEQLTKVFKDVLTKQLLPNYKASFAPELIFVGDWTEKGAINAADKALKSRARIVISLGYFSSTYLNKKQNKTKYVVTLDQYGLREVGNKFFNPVQQSVNDFVVFKRLVPNLGRTAILMNERIYNERDNWDELAVKMFKEKNCEVDFVIIPVGHNIESSLAKMPKDVGSVYITPVFNLSFEERKKLYNYLTEKKIPSFSSMGKEDVELGALMGTSAQDVDKKLAEATSFSILNTIKGVPVKTEKISFFDDNLIFLNKDTADLLGYEPHVRLLKSVEVITHKKPVQHDLSYVFNTFDKQNLSVERKKYLVEAARRATASAYLRYLPTLRMDLGYQTYNDNYAYSYNDVPKHVGGFTIGMDQVIYSPDLVTNIIVKHKKLKFDKAEKVLTEQNLGLQVANLYIDALMLKNIMDNQKEYITEVRENLAMARVRRLSGKCGQEEVLRWAGEVSKAEEKFLMLRADYENVKLHINQILFENQMNDFTLAPLTANDPAFFLSSINVMDHIRTPKKLETFTKLLIDEAVYVSPETTKLKAAIAMKKAEMSNYAQKFVMPNAKLTFEYGTQFDRNLPYEGYLNGQLGTLRQYYGDGKTDALLKNSARFFIGAQWKPIEGGTKIAEIARCKSELNELNTYLTQINTEIEFNIRSIVNRAIARYLCIERAYKTLFAESENYQKVKAKYLIGEAPITQLVDALSTYNTAKVDAQNAQYQFYKEIIWLQRGLASVNWANASEQAKEFIRKIPETLPPEPDINVNL